jgi:radical SAM protein with 4Fe4S-binding SPASM domain
MLAVDVDGTFYPCLRYAPLSIGTKQKLLRIGDVWNGLVVTPADKEIVDMLNAITWTSQSSQECIDCPISAGCGWCSAYNYEYTGDVNKRVTFICVMHKARVLAASYYWNSIYHHEGLPERFAVNLPKDKALEFLEESEYDMLVALAQTPEVNEENDDE